MLDGNEIEVNKPLSTTPLHTLLLIIPFFVVRATLNAIKKIYNVKATKGKHGWRLLLHSITTELCPNKWGITTRDVTKLSLHIFLDIIVFYMERTNWPRFRNAVITAVRPPDFIQFYSITCQRASSQGEVGKKTESVETLPPQSHLRGSSSRLPNYSRFSLNGHPCQYMTLREDAKDYTKKYCWISLAVSASKCTQS